MAFLVLTDTMITRAATRLPNPTAMVGTAFAKTATHRVGLLMSESNACCATSAAGELILVSVILGHAGDAQ